MRAEELIADGIDWRRLPHEITRVVENEIGVLIEQITPGLLMKVDGDEVVIYERGNGELCRLDLWRIADIDHDALVAALDHPDAVAAAVRGELVIDAPPDSTWVRCWVSGRPETHWGVHRSLVVEGWPWAED